jgi:hypothetical protein
MAEQLIDDKTAKEWVEAWSKTMVMIWQDRIARLKAVQSGSLLGSVENMGAQFSGDGIDRVSVVHRFIRYGVYVDMGVGREMGGERYADTTADHKQGQLVREVVRKPKPWFSNPYFSSTQNLKDFLAKTYGDEFVAMLAMSAKSIAKAVKTQ